VALQEFKRKLDGLKVEKVLAFGTSALRNAKNSKEIIDKIKSTTGIETQIISGDEEAGLIYKGVDLALHFGNERSLIIDIGGGSVEFIIGNGEEIFWKQSFEIGAQRLLERFQKHDPILPTEIDEINLYFQESLVSLLRRLEFTTPKF